VCLTRDQIKEWTGGGLHSPTDLGENGRAQLLHRVDRRGKGSGESNDLKPNEGIFRCPEKASCTR
jgi:hypothetical protein